MGQCAVVYLRLERESSPPFEACHVSDAKGGGTKKCEKKTTSKMELIARLAQHCKRMLVDTQNDVL